MKERIEQITKTKDPEDINDFLIEIGKNPEKISLSLIKSLIDKLKEKEIFSKVLLNLAWLLGEISRYEKLDTDLIEMLIQNYYKSDRWIRNEILKTFFKIMEEGIPNESILNLLGEALFDDYLPITINSLKSLSNYKDLPQEILIKILKLLNSDNKEITKKASLTLHKFIQSKDKIFTLLNQREVYKIITSKALRTILLSWFPSIQDLELFRRKINDSNWKKETKIQFLKEIDTYEVILKKMQD